MTIARRLYVVLGIMVLLISAELSALWLTIHTLSAVRAYVAGEGVWSKAEKDAAYHLEAYGRTRDPREYRAYQALLTVWAGDHQANLGLASQNPNLQRITAGFVQGGNDPADVPGMISLFQRFGSVSFISEAIHTWSAGDVLMVRFQALGTQLDEEVRARQSPAVIDRTLSQIADINNQLTVIEDHFSDTLGLGSRWLTSLVLEVLLGAALVVELTGLLLTAGITRGISLRLKDMLHASGRVSLGDFSVRLDERKRDEIGRLAAAFNTMTGDLDVARKRAADAVSAREESLREAQRVAHIGVWDLTFATDVVNWSREVSRLHGIPSQDARELTFAEFVAAIDPIDSANVESAVRASRAFGEPFSIDYRVTLADRSVRWLCADATIECDPSGTPVRVLGTTRDITERKHTEKLRVVNGHFSESALASAEPARLMQEAAELVSDALAMPLVRIGVLDAERDVLVYGAGTGWPVHLVGGHALPISADPQASESLRSGRLIAIERIDGDITLEPSFEARALDAVASITVPIRGKTAILGLLHVAAREPRMLSADDEHFLLSIGTIVGMAMDRDRSEQRIKALNVELQHRYAELETFSYSVAHDLRAPLRAVAGFATALEEDYGFALDDEARRYIGLIVRGAAQMGGLIDALLSLARVSRQEISSSNVDLSAKARAILAELWESDPDRRVEISVEDDLVAAGDSGLLFVMLANLLGNAWKFTRGRDVARIRFATVSVGDETAYAISDNGIGFATERPEELFAPFKRLHDRSFEGTGIGLATVARIVQRHGGRVWAESVPGRGATFYFTLGKVVLDSGEPPVRLQAIV